MKKHFAVLYILAAFLICSCSNYGFYELLLSEDTVDERSSSMTYIDAPSFASQTPAASSVYSGLVISDVHFGSNNVRYDDEFLSVFRRLLGNADSTLIPRFVICLGDTADGGHQTEYLQYLNFVESIKKIAKEELGDPDYKVYTIVGNHDLYNDGWSKWKHLVYPYTTSYFFTLNATSSSNGFTFYFLDTANGSIGVDQLESFEKLAKADSRPKIVLSHYPIYLGGLDLFKFQNTQERDNLIKIMAKNNVKQVFEGHAHTNYDVDNGAFHESVTCSLVKNRGFRLFTVNENTSTVVSVVLSY